MNTYYVYTHTRLDNGTVFYVGIGTLREYGDQYKRAYTKAGRNRHWKNIVNKHGYSVSIVEEFDTRKEAEEAEIALIWFYGRRDKGLGLLVNYTDGGGGIVGYTHTAGAREKNRIAVTGRVLSEATKEKLRQHNLGKKASEETKAKLRGRVHTEEHKAKTRAVLFNRPVSIETREKMRETHRSLALSGTHNTARKIINTITGVVYPSQKEAARREGIPIDTLRGYLYGKYPNKTSLEMLPIENKKDTPQSVSFQFHQ